VLDIIASTALIMVIYFELYKVSVGVIWSSQNILFLLCVYCFPILSICNYFNFQKYPTDRAYFIAKEILMTERTYKKDLEVISLVSYVTCVKEQKCSVFPVPLNVKCSTQIVAHKYLTVASCE